MSVPFRNFHDVMMEYEKKLLLLEITQILAMVEKLNNSNTHTKEYSTIGITDNLITKICQCPRHGESKHEQARTKLCSNPENMQDVYETLHGVKAKSELGTTDKLMTLAELLC